MSTLKKTLISLAAVSALSTNLFADAEVDTLKAQLKSLTERLNSIESQNTQTEEKTDALFQEMIDAKEADSIGQYSGESYAGMSPGISKVYTNKNKLSVGGYGKVDYVNYRDSGKTDTADAYRAILYFGYRVTDSIILNSEIEFEHGGNTDNGGGIEVEMLALDFLVNEDANFRVGTFILPIGIVSVQHEPTLFNTVTRPNTEVSIIPSSWYENGAMVYGSTGPLSYKTGVVAGFNARKGTVLRSMRSQASKSAAEDAGYYLRLDYAPSENFTLAGSYYFGNAGQNNAGLGEVDVNLWEVHTTVQAEGFQLNALYAAHEIGDAEAVAAVNGDDATKEAFGYYVNLNYTAGDWVPFVQYEVTNKFDKGVDAAGTSFYYDDDRDITLGINWKPHPQVVLKADYVFGELGQKNGGTLDNDRFQLGMGYVF